MLAPLDKCDTSKYPCPHDAVWKLRTLDEYGGHGPWSYACGIHLHYAGTYELEGEQGRLELVRIVTDDRYGR
jgi:hypothetical protein